MPLRGAAARIVANMEESLHVPTATSFREVPARLLEVNRSVINGYLSRTRGGKVSFTHLIGFAVVRAIAETMPVMNSSYSELDDGRPSVIHHADALLRHVDLRPDVVVRFGAAPASRVVNEWVAASGAMEIVASSTWRDPSRMCDCPST